jgi:hypothetical protein
MATTDGDDTEPATPSLPADRVSDLALARLIGRSLARAALRLGVPTDGAGFDDLSEHILEDILERWRATGQIDETDAGQYRVIFRTREMLASRKEPTTAAL